MRTFKSSFMPLALFISCLSLWMGCAKSRKQEVCVKCKPNFEVIKDIKLAGQSFSVGVNKETGYDNFIFSQVQNESNETDARMQEIVKALDTDHYFDRLLNQRYIPVSYDVYLRKNLKQVIEISEHDIVAVSVVMYKDLGLHHFLYLRDSENKIKVDEKYNAVTDALWINNKKLVFEGIINDGRTTISLITMVSPSYMEIMNRVRTKDELEKILLKTMSANNRSISTNLFDDPPRCDPHWCEPYAWPGKCQSIVGGTFCKAKDPHPCAKQSIAMAFNKVEEFIQMENTFYTFQDSVLANSANGQVVIKNYYLASAFLENHLNQLNLRRMWDYIILLHDKVSFLLSDSESNQILFDLPTKNDALGLISELRLLDTNSEWQGLLDWLESLVNQFAGESTSTVYNYLSS